MVVVAVVVAIMRLTKATDRKESGNDDKGLYLHVLLQDYGRMG